MAYARAAVALPNKNTWVKVASNYTLGWIEIKEQTKQDYFYTAVATSGAAPTDESTAIKISDAIMYLNHTVAIDVYMLCRNDNGSVVVSHD